jgi:hypothetical protein
VNLKWTLNTFNALIFSLSNYSYACLWQGGEEAYWPTNSIKVCFTNLNESPRHRHVASVVENALQDLDRQTRFRFMGYGECLESERDEHQIRIDLQDIGASARAYSIGPSSGLMWPSTTLPLGGSTDPRTQAIVTDSFIRYTTYHEIMHLLGVHHDHERGSKAYESLNEDHPDLVTYGPYDPDSIMLNNEGLSPGDLRCLNMIAARRMHLVYNGSQSTTYSDFETEVRTTPEEVYYQSDPNSIN